MQMKSYFKIFEKVKNQAGVSAVIIAIVLPLLIGITALGIDVGYMYVNRNELQNVADAAALAATRKLGTIYQGMTYLEQQVYVCGDDDIEAIKDVANAVAHNNKAGGRHMIVYGMTDDGINIDNVEIGVWDPNDIPLPSEDFTNYEQPDAVRVKVRSRDNATGRSISTWFANIFGIDTVNVSAYATAALTGQNSVGPGELPLPLAMSSLALDECQDPITFAPTQDACAGWTGFNFTPVNTTLLGDILTGKIESPPLGIGDEVNFIGGALSDGTFTDLLLLFRDKGYDIREDGTPVLLYGDVYTDEELEVLKLDPEKPFPGHLDDTDGVVKLLDNGVQLYYPDPLPPYKDDPTLPRNKHLWETTILVYDEGDPSDETECSNPNQSMIIYGFATILLTDVYDAGGEDGKTVIGNLICNTVNENDNRGGGGETGAKGSIPNLVE
jgi:hypothetical protein